MRLITLPTYLTIIVDILAWGIIQLSIASLSLKFTDKFLTNELIFKTFKIEKEGSIYQLMFRVKSWKDKLPDGSKILKRSFSKNTFNSKDKAYLDRFLIEINRAEIAHWLQILPAPLFFLFNLEWVGWIMVIYAFLNNLPFIIVQRFNRARLIKLLRQM